MSGPTLWASEKSWVRTMRHMRRLMCQQERWMRRHSNPALVRNGPASDRQQSVSGHESNPRRPGHPHPWGNP